jgi:hypothetical protein
MKWVLVTHFERLSRVLAVLCTIRQIYMMLAMIAHIFQALERDRAELNRLEKYANERLPTT